MYSGSRPALAAWSPAVRSERGQGEPKQGHRRATVVTRRWEPTRTTSPWKDGRGSEAGRIPGICRHPLQAFPDPRFIHRVKTPPAWELGVTRHDEVTRTFLPGHRRHPLRREANQCRGLAACGHVVRTQREVSGNVRQARHEVQHQCAPRVPLRRADDFTVRSHGKVRRVRVGIVSQCGRHWGHEGTWTRMRGLNTLLELR